MKTDLYFRNKYDQMHFDDLISEWKCVQLEVTWRSLWEYKHVVFTPYQWYDWRLYATDIYKEIISRNSIRIWLYTWRFLQVEKVIWSIQIDKFKISNWYIEQELKWWSQATIDFLKSQEILWW